MPRITVEVEVTFDVEAGKKLVLCLEDNGIDVLHRCGGVPACTTCRCQVISGDVPPMTTKEEEALEDPSLIASWRSRLAKALCCAWTSSNPVRSVSRSRRFASGLGSSS